MAQDIPDMYTNNKETHEEEEDALARRVCCVCCNIQRKYGVLWQLCGGYFLSISLYLGFSAPYLEFSASLQAYVWWLGRKHLVFLHETGGGMLVTRVICKPLPYLPKYYASLLTRLGHCVDIASPRLRASTWPCFMISCFTSPLRGRGFFRSQPPICSILCLEVAYCRLGDVIASMYISSKLPCPLLRILSSSHIAPIRYGGPNQKSFPPSYLGRVHMKRYAVINLAYAKPMQRIGRAFFTTTAG